MNPFTIAGYLLMLAGLCLIARTVWHACKPKPRTYTIHWGDDLK